MQDNIAKRVVGAAAVNLTRVERERVLAKPTKNLAAYQYVLRGRDAFSHDTRDSNDEASELFQRAIDLDPSNADAYAALGFSHYQAVISGWSEFRTEELARAEALAQKALALDPATTRAYRLLSNLHLFRKRFDLALAQIDRALEANPSDANNYAARGGILVWAGKAAEALPWLEGALRFDQADGFAAARLCMTYYLLRRYPEALDAGDRALSRNPGRNTQMLTHPMLAAAYAELGRLQDAERERAIAARLWPLLSARMFADQFGTDEARDHVLHNWKGGGTVDGTRSLDVMKLARAGYLTDSRLGSWEWNYRDGSTASVSITGGREAIRLDYRLRTHGERWESVSQRIPIRWTSCRFGGERPWFLCDVRANGVYCGRRVAKLYGGGRLFACRYCYRLGYAIQRNGPIDRAHHNLSRLHRKLRADYDRPDMPPPPKPKWMRCKTYARITEQIEAGQERLDVVFTIGAKRLLDRLEKSEQPRRNRRWTQCVLPRVADPGSYGTTRFNALRHGVLSRYTVLPWEDEAEYQSLLGAIKV